MNFESVLVQYTETTTSKLTITKNGEVRLKLSPDTVETEEVYQEVTDKLLQSLMDEKIMTNTLRGRFRQTETQGIIITMYQESKNAKLPFVTVGEHFDPVYRVHNE